MKKRLVIGGPLDGEKMCFEHAILKYPSVSIEGDDFIYRKEDLGVSNGPDGKNYNFLIPEDWDVFDMMDHIMENYPTESNKAE